MHSNLRLSAGLILVVGAVFAFWVRKPSASASSLGEAASATALAWPESPVQQPWKADGREFTVDLDVGQSVRLATDPAQFGEDWIALWAQPDSSIRVWTSTMESQGQAYMTFGPSSLQPPKDGVFNGMTGLVDDGSGCQNCLVSMFFEPKPGGMRIHCFAASRPDLAPKAAEIERAFQAGQCSKAQRKAALFAVWRSAGMLPRHTGNRQLVAHLFEYGMNP